MPFDVQCECGRKFRARDETAGRLVRCPECKSPIRVQAGAMLQSSQTALALPSPPRLPSPHIPTELPGPRVTLALEGITIGQILLGMLFVWGLSVLATFLVAASSTLEFAGLLCLNAFLSLGFLITALLLMQAKKTAMLKGEASCWFGLLGISAWDPNQGILFLKDKMIGPVDSNPHDGGGVMLLLPWLGEEVAFRAPLEVRTTKFEDRDVLTREYVPLTIKGAIYWRVVDLERFYLSVSRSIHKVDDRGQHIIEHGRDGKHGAGAGALRAGTSFQLEAGEEWLRLIAEEQTRAEVIQARTGLLVADKIVEGLPAEMQSLLASDSYHKAADGLAEGIRKRIETVGHGYGIHVDRVSLQEVQLDEQIRRKAVDACVSAYKPLIAQREAIAKKAEFEAEAHGVKKMLEGEAQVIGADAVAKREVLGSVKPFAFGRGLGIMEVLENVFDQTSGNDKATHSKTVDSKSIAPRSDERRKRENSASEPQPQIFIDDDSASKVLLNEAKKHYEAGERSKSVELLRRIVAEFAGTRAADFARENLKQMKNNP